MIDTVIFDFGGMLLTWDPVPAVVPPFTLAQWDEFCREVDWPRFNAEQDAGRSVAEARAWLATHHPQWEAVYRQYTDNFPASLTGTIAGAGELVAELHAAGVALYGLTNWPAEHFPYAAIAQPAINLLRDVVVSGQVGLAKPDPRIFALARDRFAVEPQRTAYIDDAPANVRAAADCGFAAVQFTDVPQVRARLRELGLAV
ncbi:HAD family hydrolase [Buchananella hordeovulneris]|uniref:HAD family hydrolase n=1 Tax=Buchananella hordeovulneris TaxID=52770 RepID=UPI0026DAC2C7|nr:HAD family phosphatase [Buchananella hordeovulneris]MDO5079666.1 HAD family phosphatase [Buchananella hordeovulneris]